MGKVTDTMSAMPLLSGVGQYVAKFFGRHGNSNIHEVGLIDSGAVVPVAEEGVRREILAKLASTLLGLLLSFSLTYFGIKWLSNALDPTRKDKVDAQKRAEALMKRIGVAERKLTEYELCIASNLVDPLSMVISWDDIGGLDHIIGEVQETVILPFKMPELVASSKLLQPPKGVLLYGPPGCGKTLIAKATAKATGARFINLQISQLVDKWYGESQKRAEAVFSLAVKLQPTIIFIDEIDSFLRSRNSQDHEATAMIKTQFMSFWDGLMTNSDNRIMIMGATNRPQDVDAAILRRMPCQFFIGLPKRDHRRQILEIILQNELTATDVDLETLADSTEGFSGSDLRELCRNAAVLRMRQCLTQNCEEELEAGLSAEEPLSRAMNAADFSASLTKMRMIKKGHRVTAMQPIELD